VGNLDSVARTSFERSAALDPDFAPVVFHLAELALATDSLNGAAALLKRHQALSADTAQQMQLELMLRCIREGSGNANWSSLAAIDQAGDQLLTAGRLLSSGGRHLGCAEEAFTAALLSRAPDIDVSRRWDAALGLHHIYVARGDTSRAIAIADSVVESGLPVGRGLRILEALLGLRSDSVGIAEIAWLEKPEDSLNLRRNWWFGEWSAAQRDTRRLETVARRLHLAAVLSGTPAAQVPARVMTARLILAKGDTTAAIDSLRSIRPAAPLGPLIWDFWDPLAAERFLLAQLLLAKGRTEEALQVANSFDGPRTALDIAYLRRSLELRREAAQRMNDSKLKEEFTHRLATLAAP
jgi:hypothetical protein